MSDRRIAIATPVRGSDPYSATVTVGYSEFIRLLHRVLPIEEVAASVTFGADIVRARNRIAALVLRDRPEITGILWVDDDEWAEDVSCVVRMLDKGEDVIGMPYTNKKMPSRWIHQFHDEPPVLEDDMLDVRGVGFGLTYTSRRCLERMSSIARKYTDYPHMHVVADLFGHIFVPRLEDGIERGFDTDMLLSEDFSFCHRWRALGGKVKIYAGKGNMVRHAGPYAFSARDMPGGIQ